jgi:hypothetical protein
MATAVTALAAPLFDDFGSQLYCPRCTHELEEWEVHLLKQLDCAFCGGALELGATMPLSAVLR